MQPSAVEASGLTKRFGTVVALDGVDLRVERSGRRRPHSLDAVAGFVDSPRFNPLYEFDGCFDTT